MAFKPGQSGNPAGRPAGAQNRRTLIREALEQTYPEGERGFWLQLAGQAAEGDAQAAEMIAKRLYPPLKPESLPMPFNLTGESATEQARAILAAVAAGDIPPEAGKALIDSLAAVVKIAEVDELAERLAVIEDALKQGDS
ncbi:DUF5681 domain-containing protein [Zobellella denitrificans]